MYDLIVVGAGPAGASAARRAAQQGLDTLLIERDKIPRHKLCGGGLTSKVLDLFDFRLPDALIERSVSSTRINVDRNNYSFRANRTLAIMTSRAPFDAFLTEKAIEAGSEVLDANPVLRTKVSSSHVEVIAKNGRYKSKLVVGADGINGPVARSTHLHSQWEPMQVTYAIESEVRVGERTVYDYVSEDNYFDLFFGVSPAGYGWIFPKDDHLTVGIGCRLSKLRNGRELFDAFTHIIPLLRNHEIPNPKAYLIPLGGVARLPRVGDRVMLAGDAAGFAEPFFGEGIYYAILSGQIAAKVAANACQREEFDREFLQRYELECMERFGKDFDIAYHLACFSYLEQYDMKRIVSHLFADRRVQECMIGLMDGTISYRETRAKLLWPYFKYRLDRLGLPMYND